MVGRFIAPNSYSSSQPLPAGALRLSIVRLANGWRLGETCQRSNCGTFPLKTAMFVLSDTCMPILNWTLPAAAAHRCLSMTCKMGDFHQYLPSNSSLTHGSTQRTCAGRPELVQCSRAEDALHTLVHFLVPERRSGSLIHGLATSSRL